MYGLCVEECDTEDDCGSGEVCDCNTGLCVDDEEGCGKKGCEDPCEECITGYHPPTCEYLNDGCCSKKHDTCFGSEECDMETNTCEAQPVDECYPPCSTCEECVCGKKNCECIYMCGDEGGTDEEECGHDCNVNPGCCPEGTFCSDNAHCMYGLCVEECDTEDDCGSGEVCDCNTGLCVDDEQGGCGHDCNNDPDCCPKGTFCSEHTGQCVEEEGCGKKGCNNDDGDTSGDGDDEGKKDPPDEFPNADDDDGAKKKRNDDDLNSHLKELLRFGYGAKNASNL